MIKVDGLLKIVRDIYIHWYKLANIQHMHHTIYIYPTPESYKPDDNIRAGAYEREHTCGSIRAGAYVLSKFSESTI